MNTGQISESTVTQPYSAGRCWAKVKNRPDAPKSEDRFCGKPAGKRKLSKGIGMNVEMFLCDFHAQKMTQYGYTVQRCE